MFVRVAGCCCLTRDGEYLITGDQAGVVCVYRLFGLEKLYAYQPCESAVKSVALAQNHRLINKCIYMLLVFN